MPISLEEFSTPKLVRYKTRYPISEDKKDRFYKFETDPRGYREGTFPQAGYNPNHQSTRVEKVNLRSDDVTLKPY